MLVASRRAVDQREAEIAKRASTSKSPFIRYCMTATTCLLIASAGFIVTLFSRADDVNIERTFSSRDVAPYITVKTTVTESSKWEGDSSTYDPIVIAPTVSSPVLPGIGNITLRGNCYTTVDIQASTGSHEVSGLPIYNGWPWGSATATVCDPFAMRDQLIQDIAVAAGTSIDDIRKNTNVQVVVDSYCADDLINVNGIDCMPLCFYPAWVDTDYYEKSWAGQNPAFSTAMADSVYACLVLEDNAGNNWYLPVRQSDNKGHTFPGGVAQTFLKCISYDNGVYEVNIANDVIGNSPLTYVRDISDRKKRGRGDGGIWRGTATQIYKAFSISSGYYIHYDEIVKIEFNLETDPNFTQKLRDVLKEYNVVGIATVPK